MRLACAVSCGGRSPVGGEPVPVERVLTLGHVCEDHDRPDSVKQANTQGHKRSLEMQEKGKRNPMEGEGKTEADDVRDYRAEKDVLRAMAKPNGFASTQGPTARKGRAPRTRPPRTCNAAGKRSDWVSDTLSEWTSNRFQSPQNRNPKQAFR